jgi:hypothetical protein
MVVPTMIGLASNPAHTAAPPQAASLSDSFAALLRAKGRDRGEETP